VDAAPELLGAAVATAVSGTALSSKLLSTVLSFEEWFLTLRCEQQPHSSRLSSGTTGTPRIALSLLSPRLASLSEFCLPNREVFLKLPPALERVNRRPAPLPGF
jgi:hypothetical protein